MSTRPQRTYVHAWHGMAWRRAAICVLNASIDSQEADISDDMVLVDLQSGQVRASDIDFSVVGAGAAVSEG